MYRNMLISVSCDCETVKNVVTGNSSLKPDRTGRDGKFVKQSKMLNNSAYSRLGNNNYYYLFSKIICSLDGLLAHLSQRPIGKFNSIPIVRRPPSSVWRPQCSNIFCSETAWPIKAKFYVEPPWVGGRIFFLRHLGHMTKMAATPIYGKNPSKNLLLQNRQVDFYETWFVASGTLAHHSMFK